MLLLGSLNCARIWQAHQKLVRLKNEAERNILDAPIVDPVDFESTYSEACTLPPHESPRPQHALHTATASSAVQTACPSTAHLCEKPAFLPPQRPAGPAARKSISAVCGAALSGLDAPSRDSHPAR
jgi:hypothetical protein